ncbi:MAG: LysR family transcriptional regulator [Sandaracinaceae bacterium]|nr:LysR family transcriptional regulator [Sandaracinaceae bacterium]
MNANLDWEDLALVLALSRGAGLQQAADALGVHHSTAFRRLQRAEEHAGLALFHRLGGEYAPTETGQVIAEHAARVEDELLGVQRALESREGVPRGRVRLTTVPSLVASILPALTRLSEQCPELTLELDATPDTRALERGDADLALRPTAEPPPELVGTRLSGMGWATYRRKGRPPQGRASALRGPARGAGPEHARGGRAFRHRGHHRLRHGRVHRGRPRPRAPALLRGRRAPQARARGCRGEDVHRALALEPRGAAQERPRAGHACPPGGVPDP